MRSKGVVLRPAVPCGRSRYDWRVAGPSPQVSGVLFALIGAMNVVIGVPLAKRRVGPNRWYGFRTRKTFSDPAIWYEANRILGIDLIVAGATLLAGDVALLWLRATVLPELPSGVATFGLFVLTTMGALIHSFRALRKL